MVLVLNLISWKSSLHRQFLNILQYWLIRGLWRVSSENSPQGELLKVLLYIYYVQDPKVLSPQEEVKDLKDKGITNATLQDLKKKVKELCEENETEKKWQIERIKFVFLIMMI